VAAANGGQAGPDTSPLGKTGGEYSPAPRWIPVRGVCEDHLRYAPRGEHFARPRSGAVPFRGTTTAETAAGGGRLVPNRSASCRSFPAGSAFLWTGRGRELGSGSTTGRLSTLTILNETSFFFAGIDAAVTSRSFQEGSSSS